MDLDWSTFIHAYANGRWDPHRTPNRPKQLIEVNKVPITDAPKWNYTPIISAASTEPLDGPFINVPPSSPPAESPPLSNGANEGSNPQQASAQPSTPSNTYHRQEQQFVQKPPFMGFTNTSASLKFHGLRNSMPLSLPLPSHRLRSSFSNATPTQHENLPTTTTAANAELQTTVATMRWAAARVDISPLALPSPEHELADPMRGVTAALPGAHAPEVLPDYPITPGGTRRSRLTEFWEGTTDVEEAKGQKRSFGGFRQEIKEEQLSKLVQAAAPAINIGESQSPVAQRRSHLSLLASTYPATAPSRDTYHASDIAQDDYFGDITVEKTVQATSNMTTTMTTEGVAETVSQSNITTPPQSTASIRPELTYGSELGTVSVPAMVKRICLTRQFSSPLPATFPPKDTRVFGGRIASDALHTRTSRISKEEQLYDELQYLAPPDPPDELERRRALYK